MNLIAQSENIEDFLDSNYIYVDKTEYIYNLTSNYKRVFFSRPRRFGKSLTLNTIGTLFEKGVEPYFKGTWIYDKWDQDKYPVLHLSFLEYSATDLTEFKRQLCISINKFARAQKIQDVLEDKEPNVYIANLFDAMADGDQLILLIDEYDRQLTANINNPELYEQVRICLRDFYGAIKGKKQIKFMAVTGVTRLKDASIFSVGSDILDLSYDHAYSTMIGFTRNEIKKFYVDYLKLGVSYEKNKSEDKVTDTDIEEFIDRIEEYYGGYCFDEFYENKVFSTYSVNNFLRAIPMNRRVIFGDYWYEAGGTPSILRNYLESHDIDLEKFQASEISINYEDFINPTTLLDINENVLMCQAGYLTLKSGIERPRRIKLGTANREVKSALNSLLSNKFFNPDAIESFYDADSILKNSSVEEIICQINKVLATVPYDRYPVNSESVLRALILMYLSGLRCNVTAEHHNFKGRSDLCVDFNSRRVVFEFKYTDRESEEQNKLAEAENQIIEKGYGLENLGDRELIQIACVFNGDKSKRQITRFKTVVKA